MNEATDNTALQAFITEAKAEICEGNFAYVNRAEKGSAKRKELLNNLLRANNLRKCLGDYFPDGTVLTAGVAVNTSFDVTTILGAALNYSNHIRINIIVSDTPPLTLYEARVNFEGVSTTTIFNAIKTAINAGGTGWTVSGTFPTMLVIPPVTTPANTLVTFTVHSYFNLGGAVPYLTPPTLQNKDFCFVTKTGAYNNGFLYHLASPGGANCIVRSFNGTTALDTWSSGEDAFLIQENPVTGKIYVSGSDSFQSVWELTHTLGSLTAASVGSGNYITGIVGGTCYNPINTSVYFLSSGAFVKVTVGGVVTEIVGAYAFYRIVCNTVSGELYTFNVGSPVMNVTYAASSPPTVDDTFSLAFNIAGEIGFYAVSGQYYIPEAGSAIVHVFDASFTEILPLLFVGKVVVNCYVLNTSYLFVRCGDGTVVVYHIPTTTWMCTLYDDALPTKIIHHPTSGYRTMDAASNIYAPVLVADGVDTVQTGTPIAEVLQEGEDNCLTVTEQQTMIDLLNSAINTFKEC